MVGWCEGAVYLTSPGRQLILAYSWARPAILVVGKGRGGMFLFLLFLHFHSCSSFFPAPLFHLLYSLFSPTLSSISFLPFSGRRHKMTLKGWRVVKPQHNQKIFFFFFFLFFKKSYLCIFFMYFIVLLSFIFFITFNHLFCILFFSFFHFFFFLSYIFFIH